VEEQDKKCSIDCQQGTSPTAQRDKYGTKRVKPAGRRGGWTEKRSGVERPFRSVVAPMQAARLGGTAWSHHHAHPSEPMKTLSRATVRLSWTVGHCWIAERGEPSGASGMVLFLHLRLADVSDSRILVTDSIQTGQEQEITLWGVHRSHLRLVIDVDQVVVPSLCKADNELNFPSYDAMSWMASRLDEANISLSEGRAVIGADAENQTLTPLH